MIEQLPITKELFERSLAFKKEWSDYYQSISNEPTPQIDGNGKKIVKQRPDGYDYIEESHIRNMLDKHFPGWSWEMAAPLHFLGAEWVVAQGHLVIIDEHLLAYNVNPPIRKFFGVDSVRIQYRTQLSDPKNSKSPKIPMPHEPQNIVDIGDNCKQAVTAALKYAANRLCRIGDDVYGKRTEYEGAGTVESQLEENPNASNFSKWVSEHKGLWSEIYHILGTSNLSSITDWEAAKEKVKAVKKW